MRGLLSVMLALVVHATLFAQQATDQKKVEDAAREILVAYGAAWNAGDSKALADLYTKYGDYTGFGSLMSRGLGEIQNRYASLLSGTFRGSQLSLAMSSLRMIRSDVAIVDGTLELAGIPIIGGQAQTAKGMFIAIMTQEESQWRFTTFWSKRLQTTDGER